MGANCSTSSDSWRTYNRLHKSPVCNPCTSSLLRISHSLTTNHFSSECQQHHAHKNKPLVSKMRMHNWFWTESRGPKKKRKGRRRRARYHGLLSRNWAQHALRGPTPSGAISANSRGNDKIQKFLVRGPTGVLDLNIFHWDPWCGKKARRSSKEKKDGWTSRSVEKKLESIDC